MSPATAASASERSPAADGGADALVPVPRLRGRTQQARSRARYASLLAAAERVLVTEGSAAVTTTRVAAEAGVAIGTIYHYLPDRQAILHALALTYLDGFEQRMQGFAELARDIEIPDLPGTLITAYADAYRSQPGLRALWFGGSWSAETMQADREHKGRMAQLLQELLLGQEVPDGDRLLVTCQAAVLMADAVIQDAFRRTAEGDTALLDEATAIFRTWFDTVLDGVRP